MSMIIYLPCWTFCCPLTQTATWCPSTLHFLRRASAWFGSLCPLGVDQDHVLEAGAVFGTIGQQTGKECVFPLLPIHGVDLLLAEWSRRCCWLRWCFKEWNYSYHSLQYRLVVGFNLGLASSADKSLAVSRTAKDRPRTIDDDMTASLHPMQ